MFINYHTRRVWGYASPRKCLTLQPLRLFLMASETRLGRSLSVISLLFSNQMLDGEYVFPNARSAKLQIVYGLNMSKIAALDTFTIQTFYMYMYMCCAYGW